MADLGNLYAKLVLADPPTLLPSYPQIGETVRETFFRNTGVCENWFWVFFLQTSFRFFVVLQNRHITVAKILLQVVKVQKLTKKIANLNLKKLFVFALMSKGNESSWSFRFQIENVCPGHILGILTSILPSTKILSFKLLN